MGIRVNPDFYNDLVVSLGHLRQQEDRDLKQLASGSRLNQISDDPAAVADLVIMRSQSSETDQFLKNVLIVRGSLQLADSALSSAVSVLNRAMALGTEGSNGTLTASNRQAIATEVRGIVQQMVSLANTAYQGNYLFAGTAVTTAPFAVDPLTGAVTYQGNAASNSVQIGQGQFTPTGLPGSQLFAQPGADVFQALNDLAQALQSNGDVVGATVAVQGAFKQVNQQRSFYGSAMSRLDAAQQFLSSEQIRQASDISSLSSADIAKVASDLSQVEIVKNTALAAAARATQLHLLDYLK